MTETELQELQERGKAYYTLTELNPNSQFSIGVELVNIEWQPVDISLRVRLNSNFNPIGIRKDMQNRINRYLDYRFWNLGQRVEWDDMLEIAKRTEGVEYVVDNFFYPNNDIPVNFPTLPRVRGFLLLDEDGQIISDGTQNLNPIYYPSNPDFSFHSTVLANL